MAAKPLPDVRVGDVWTDNDPRATRPRTITITEVDGAFVRGVTKERSVRIARERMRPTATGYRLIERGGQAV